MFPSQASPRDCDFICSAATSPRFLAFGFTSGTVAVFSHAGKLLLRYCKDSSPVSISSDKRVTVCSANSERPQPLITQSSI